MVMRGGHGVLFAIMVSFVEGTERRTFKVSWFAASYLSSCSKVYGVICVSRYKKIKGREGLCKKYDKLIYFIVRVISSSFTLLIVENLSWVLKIIMDQITESF
jgi:hypothetical protein